MCDFRVQTKEKAERSSPVWAATSCFFFKMALRKVNWIFLTFLENYPAESDIKGPNQGNSWWEASTNKRLRLKLKKIVKSL